MHAIATWCEILLELLFLLWSSSVLFEYDDHFITSVFCVNCTLATHHFHYLIVADGVLRLVQICISCQTSCSRFIFIFWLKDSHRGRVRHYLLLAPLGSQALPYELLLRMLVGVGCRTGIRPLLFSSLTMSSRLWIFVRIIRFFGDICWRLIKLLARACIWTFFLSDFSSHIWVAARFHVFCRCTRRHPRIVRGLFIRDASVLSGLCSWSWVLLLLLRGCSAIVEVIDDVCNVGHFVTIMVMEVAMLLLFRLPIAALLSMVRYLLIFRFLIFLGSRLMQLLTPLIAAAVLHSSYRRLLLHSEVLRVAWLLRINTELIACGGIRRLWHRASIYGLLLPSLLRLLSLFFRHEMPL